MCCKLEDLEACSPSLCANSLGAKTNIQNWKNTLTSWKANKLQKPPKRHVPKGAKGIRSPRLRADVWNLEKHQPWRQSTQTYPNTIPMVPMVCWQHLTIEKSCIASRCSSKLCPNHALENHSCTPLGTVVRALLHPLNGKRPHPTRGIPARRKALTLWRMSDALTCVRTY